VTAILQGKIEEAGLSAAERALLGYAKLITEAAHRSSGEDVQKLRDLGWKDEQIAESVYIIALFAFFNRVADAFGVPSMNYLTGAQGIRP
jgi:alkylhydroperoxidase family enzyme